MTSSYTGFILSPDGARNYFMKKRNEYLGMLKAPITQGKGKDKRWYTYVPDPGSKYGRHLIKKPTKEEVEAEVIKWFMAKEETNAKSDMTVLEGWQLWYDWRKENDAKVAASSLQIFRNGKKRFFEGTKFAGMRLRDVDEIDIENFLLEQVKRYCLDVKPTSQLAGWVSGIFFVAYRKRIIPENPWQRVSLTKVVYPACVRKKPKPDRLRILSDTQMYCLMETVENNLSNHPDFITDYGILIARYTGLRAGEIVALMWEDIHDGCINVCHSEQRIPDENGGKQTYEVGETKTKRERLVPICPELSNIFDRIRETDETYGIDNPYVIAGKNGRPNANQLEKACARRGIKAGIEGTTTIHRIRRTVDSKLNTVFDRATVSHIMGHSEEVDAGNYDYDTRRQSELRETMQRLLA